MNFKKILIIEDNQDLLHILNVSFENEKFIAQESCNDRNGLKN